MLERIKALYEESIKGHIATAAVIPEILAKTTNELTQCLLRGNKIAVFGYGRSTANAQLLVANLINRYQLARPSFPAVSLGLEGTVGAALLSDNNLLEAYQKQFNAMVQSGDILVVLTPDTEEISLSLIRYAKEKDILVVALTGDKSDHLNGLLDENDINIAVPVQKEVRVLEQHLFIINTLCELIDFSLFSH
ncbi:SIS domain-containing protein [Gallibacterium trehalosifermentans]|uniref:SIS domain-containing protein n=1 Tax=Gallibacterium trehalosifermentans TaxID=516935 RepID=A0ABV6H0U2_9PAST